MPDLVDRANDLAEFLTNAALVQATNRAPVGESASYCVECGDPIPEARREAMPGVQTCIFCASELESARS